MGVNLQPGAVLYQSRSQPVDDKSLARTSKMGQRDIQRLLITGTMAVIRWAIRKGPPHLDHGLQRCRPTSLVCVWRLHWQTSLPVLFGR